MTVQTWLIATLKGGTRKSTTAIMTALAAAQAGREVLLVDADPGTQGVTDWATRVYAAGDEMPVDVVQWSPHVGLLVPFVQHKLKETGDDLAIFDTGGENPELLQQAIHMSSLAISPVGADQAELSRLAVTKSILDKEHIPMHVMLTRVPEPGKGAARDTRQQLVSDGYTVLKTETRQNREQYADVWGTVPENLHAYRDLYHELHTLTA